MRLKKLNTKDSFKMELRWIITDNHIRIEKKDEIRELLIVNRISSFCFVGYEERQLPLLFIWSFVLAEFHNITDFAIQNVTQHFNRVDVYVLVSFQSGQLSGTHTIVVDELVLGDSSLFQQRP